MSLCEDMTRGRAKLAFSEGISVWVLDAPEGFGDADFHSHHAIQITVALTGELRLETDQSEIEAPMLAVDADKTHRFRAAGLLAFIFIEPEGRIGSALKDVLFNESQLVELTNLQVRQKLDPLMLTFESALEARDLLRAGRAAVESLVPDAKATLPDPRIQRIIDYAASHLDEALTLSSSSADVHLSESRLRHLFVEQTGLAFKTYVLWLRLMRAVNDYSLGKSLTEAAHAAGFSDSAHFSRTFKRTFGLPATTLTRL